MFLFTWCLRLTKSEMRVKDGVLSVALKPTWLNYRDFPDLEMLRNKTAKQESGSNDNYIKIFHPQKTCTNSSQESLRKKTWKKLIFWHLCAILIP